MQTVSHGGIVKGNKLNFKTVLVKGLLWALIGAFVGFGISEVTDKNITSDVAAARLSGHSELVDYFEYREKADAAFDKAFDEFESYCKKKAKILTLPRPLALGTLLLHPLRPRAI